jgi:hypothetical protein
MQVLVMLVSISIAIVVGLLGVVALMRHFLDDTPYAAPTSEDTESGSRGESRS